MAPPAPMFSTAFGGAAASPPRRVLPWILLAVGLALVVAAYLLGERLPGWIGIGEEVESAHVAPSGERSRTPGSVQPPPTQTVTQAEPPASATGLAPSGAADRPSRGSAAPDPGPFLTRLDRITWAPIAEGTEVVLWGDGAIGSEVYTRTRLEGNPPRELIRLSGIRRSYPEPRLVVGTPEVLQIRIGYHPEAGQGELHVVLDLARPNVEVTATDAGQHQLRLRLRRK